MSFDEIIKAKEIKDIYEKTYKAVKEMSEEEMGAMISVLSNYIIIPNWFRKECVEDILDKKVSEDEYMYLLNRCDKSELCNCVSDLTRVSLKMFDKMYDKEEVNEEVDEKEDDKSDDEDESDDESDYESDDEDESDDESDYESDDEVDEYYLEQVKKVCDEYILEKKDYKVTTFPMHLGGYNVYNFNICLRFKSTGESVNLTHNTYDMDFNVEEVLRKVTGLLRIIQEDLSIASMFDSSCDNPNKDILFPSFKKLWGDEPEFNYSQLLNVF
jgi:hypothetical protein